MLQHRSAIDRKCHYHYAIPSSRRDKRIHISASRVHPNTIPPKWHIVRTHRTVKVMETMTVTDRDVYAVGHHAKTVGCVYPFKPVPSAHLGHGTVYDKWRRCHAETIGAFQRQPTYVWCFIVEHNVFPYAVGGVHPYSYIMRRCVFAQHAEVAISLIIFYET